MVKLIVRVHDPTSDPRIKFNTRANLELMWKQALTLEKPEL